MTRQEDDRIVENAIAVIAKTEESAEVVRQAGLHDLAKAIDGVTGALRKIVHERVH